LIVDEVGDAQLALDQTASALLGLVFLPRFVISSSRTRAHATQWSGTRAAAIHAGHPQLLALDTPMQKAGAGANLTIADPRDRQFAVDVEGDLP
jgi:hypothetical protein